MAKISPLMAAPPIVFAALAGLFFWGMQREEPNELPSAMIGKAAPAVDVTPVSGKPVFEDAMLRTGEVKVVNFFASWCAPCRVEHPRLEEMADAGVTIYGVNYKDDEAKALKFLADMGDPYEGLGADANGRMALDWGVYGVPETYVIDGEGKILYRQAGPITKRVMEEEIMPLLDLGS